MLSQAPRWAPKYLVFFVFQKDGLQLGEMLQDTEVVGEIKCDKLAGILSRFVQSKGVEHIH